MRKRSVTGASMRRPARFTTTIDPVVMRTFRKVCKRRGHPLNVVERLMVCWLRSDDWAKCDAVEAGQMFRNASERRKQLGKLAASITSPFRQQLREVMEGGSDA